MKCLSEESEYDSSEDECNIKPIQRRENNPNKANRVARADDNEEVTLKPKFHDEDEEKLKIKDKNASKVMENASKVTIASRKNLMDAYTFKRDSSHRLKKHDPVSLYAQTKQSWNSNKFLKSRADAKESRKLDLEKRNRAGKLL